MLLSPGMHVSLSHPLSHFLPLQRLQFPKDLACTGFSPPGLFLTPSVLVRALISQSYPISFVLQSPQLSPPQCFLNASASQPGPFQGGPPDCSAFLQTPVTLTSSPEPPPCAHDTLPTRQHEIFHTWSPILTVPTVVTSFSGSSRSNSASLLPQGM